MQVFLLELLPFNSLDSYAPQACEILFNPLNRALRAAHTSAAGLLTCAPGSAPALTRAD